MEAPPTLTTTKRKVVIILGATATGKTRLAIEIALHFNGEVVNADSMQVYRSLNIMAAKATMVERRSVPHHCMDVIAVTDPSFNASKFVEIATASIEEISSRGRLPIVVGGTHQYLEALLWKNYSSTLPTNNCSSLDDAALATAALEQLKPLHQQQDTQTSLYDVLKLADPLTFNKLHPSDDRKIRRALELFVSTGIPPSSAILSQQMDLRYDPCIIWLDTKKEALYTRLDKRVDSMLAEGLLHEARSIRAEFISANIALDFTRGALQAIGFKELEPYLAAETTNKQTPQLLDSCVADMKTRSRNYARTQLKWVKHHFCTRLQVFRLDTTDAGTWQSQVFSPAMTICEDFIANAKSLRVQPLPLLAVKTEVSVAKWQKYQCETCDKQVNGQTEWEAHLKSRGTQCSRENLVSLADP